MMVRKVALRLVVALAVLSVLGGLLPKGAPNLTQPVEASGWTTHYAAAWFSTDFWKVEEWVSWQTTDPSSTCYQNAVADPSGTPQYQVLSSWIGRCPNSADYAHWYPIQNVSVSCWVANSFIYGVEIKGCGYLRDPFWPNANASQTKTVGSLFQVCLGPYQIFGWCTGGWMSRVTIVGSMVRVYNDEE